MKRKRRSTFSFRVALSILLVSMLSAGACVGFFFVRERDLRVEFADSSQKESLSWSRAELDASFQLAKELFGAMQADSSLFELIQDYDPTVMSPISANRAFNEILNTHLPYTTNIHAVQLLRSDLVLYNTNVTYTSVYNLDGADFYQTAHNRSHAFWVGTYDFTKAYGHTRLEALPIANRNLVSLVGEMNLYSLSQGKLQYLSAGVEHPVLVISLTENYLRESLPHSEYDGAFACVADEAGRVLSSNGGCDMGETLPEALLTVLESSQKESRITLAGKTCMVMYQTLNNGWTLLSAVPMDSVVSGVIEGIWQPFLLVLCAVLPIVLVLSLSLSRALGKPIRMLRGAIEQVQQGDFDVNLPDTGDEFSLVMSSYNRMAGRIITLIEENYQARAHEQENEMLALRYQTNPHFLYNALNILHMNAVRNGDQETAGLILLLSQVMRYVIRDTRDVVTLREEIDNVQKYFTLIRVGYEQGIRMACDVQEAVLDALLPKLSIQPLVENAVQHGLSQRQGDGLVRVTARAEQGEMVIQIEDNGTGLPPCGIQEGAGGKASIGIANVRRRMAFLFAGSSLTTSPSPLGGLCVTLRLPLKTRAENKG